MKPGLDERPRSITSLVFKAGWFGLVFAGQVVGGLLLVPLGPRVLGQDQFGELATATSFALLFRAVAGLGLPAGLTMVYFNRSAWRERTRALLILASVVPLVIGLLAGMLALPFRNLVPLPLLLGIFLGSVVAASTTAQTWARNNERAGLYAVGVWTAGFVGQFLALAIAWNVGTESASFFIAVWTVVAFLGTVFLLLFPTLQRPASADKAGLQLSLRLGFPTVFHGVAIALIVGGDRLVLRAFATPETVGQYFIAYTIGTVSIALLNGVAPAWSPFVLSAAPNVRGVTLRRSLTLVLIVSAWFSALLAVLARPVAVHFVLDGFLNDSVIVISILSLVTLPAAINVSCQIWLYHAEFARGIAISSGIGAGASLALNLLLIPTLGSVGAAAATVVSYSCMAGAAYFFAQRRGGAAMINSVGLLGASLLILVGSGVSLLPVSLDVRVAACLGLTALSVVLLRWELGSARRD